VARHQGSSPTLILDAIDQFSKGMFRVMAKLVLLEAEVKDLRRANETLSKRRNRKKSRLLTGGSFNLQEAQTLMDERDVADQIKQDIQSGSGCRPRIETRVRRCGNCNETGHNSRTCQIVIETSEEEDSE
jgi:hypothetical protein